MIIRILDAIVQFHAVWARHREEPASQRRAAVRGTIVERALREGRLLAQT